MPGHGGELKLALRYVGDPPQAFECGGNGRFCILEPTPSENIRTMI